jgi:hypothetical protein
MVYNTQDYWVFGLCSSSGILKHRRTQHFGNFICFRPLLGPLERANLSHWTIYFITTFFFNGSSSLFRALASYSVPYSFLTVGRTPWTSDQLATRSLPKHRTTQTQKDCIHTPNIRALRGIRTHDPSVRASEDSSCLRPRGYCDRHLIITTAI